MEKAFDKVWRDVLKLELRKNGISGCMYRWLSQYLENRKARVQLNSCYSRKNTLRGVPQGGVLSPTLFLIYINDIFKGMHSEYKERCMQMILSCGAQRKASMWQRTEYNKHLYEWTKRWMVRLNADKTTYSVFSLSPNQKKVVLKINGECLKHELSPTYLNITFYRRLHTNPTVKKQRRKPKPA